MNAPQHQQPLFPIPGDVVVVNGRMKHGATHHERRTSERGIVTSVDHYAAERGLPGIEVVFETEGVNTASRFELFFPLELNIVVEMEVWLG